MACESPAPSSIPAIRPISVCIPVATTKPRARPEQDNRPLERHVASVRERQAGIVACRLMLFYRHRLTGKCRFPQFEIGHFVGDVEDTVVILGIVVLNATVGFVQVTEPIVPWRP